MSLSPSPWRMPLMGPSDQLTPTWRDWFRDLAALVNRASAVQAARVWEQQTDSVAETTLYTVAKAGLYRISWGLEIQTPATDSSDLWAQVVWTSHGYVMTVIRPAITSNVIGTVESYMEVCSPDVGTAITFSVTAGSVGVTPLQYGARVAVEALQP